MCLFVCALYVSAWCVCFMYSRYEFVMNACGYLSYIVFVEIYVLTCFVQLHVLVCYVSVAGVYENVYVSDDCTG